MPKCSYKNQSSFRYWTRKRKNPIKPLIFRIIFYLNSSQSNLKRRLWCDRLYFGSTALISSHLGIKSLTVWKKGDGGGGGGAFNCLNSYWCVILLAGPFLSRRCGRGQFSVTLIYQAINFIITAAYVLLCWWRISLVLFLLTRFALSEYSSNNGFCTFLTKPTKLNSPLRSDQ